MQDPAARAANQQRRSLLGLAFIVIAVSALAGYLIFGAVQSDRGGQTLTVRPDVQPDLTAEPAPAKPRVVPELLPEITLANREGVPTALSSYAGRPLLINFWATWCAPCRREIPLLNELRQERTQQKLEIVGIAVDFREDVLQYVKETQVDYPLLIGEEDGLAAADAFGVGLAFPVSIFVDGSSRILAVKVGELHRDEADFILDRVADVDSENMAPDTARAAIAAELQRLASVRAESTPDKATTGG